MSYRDRRDDDRDRDRSRHDRRGASSSRRSPSPPPKPRSDKELPESFGRVPEDKDDDSNVLQRMNKKFLNAPLGSLTKCLSGNRKIKVWTRNFKEVRGICTGYVVAFDKHWNLVMADVDEVYLKRKKHKTPFFDDLTTAENFAELPKKTPKEKKDPSQSAASVEAQENQPPAAMETQEIQPPAPMETQENEPPSTVESASEDAGAGEKDAQNKGEKKKKKKRRRKKKGSAPQKRHVKQLFVRGDSIVMAAILESEDEG